MIRLASDSKARHSHPAVMLLEDDLTASAGWKRRVEGVVHVLPAD